ncbi:MAG: four-carbon acid sugar kinase family protein, partial [Bacteroidota bacterium]
MNNGTKIFLKDLESRFNKLDEEWVNREYNQALQNLNLKIVVLDDDPTGVQTVHGVSVYTDWSEESISSGFAEENSLFFILTNSRSFSQEKTTQVHREIAELLVKVSQKTGRDFLVISRGDSTLRGHYPLETQVLRDTIEAESGVVIDGEIIIPFFKEGGRLTVEDTHYVLKGEALIPAAETEFAKDRTFGYSQSHLGNWIQEKTASKYKAGDVEYISLQTIREMDYEQIEKQLHRVTDFQKVVVNALEYSDLKLFMVALA